MSFVFEYLTSITLGLMMAGMGLALRPAHFKRLGQRPKAVLVGVVGQLIGLPLLGFSVAVSFNLSPTQAVGIMILVSCAGGVVSGLLTQMARGDTALSITMTAISMLVGTVSIPFIINLSLSHFLQQSEYVQLDLVATSLRLLAMTILPVVLGMLLRQLRPEFSIRIAPTIARASNVLLLGIIGLTLFGSGKEIAGDMNALIVPMFILNILAMALGYISASVAGLEFKETKTLTIEVGIQNSATGIFIATSLLNNTLLALPAMIYTGVAFLNVALFILIYRKRISYAKTV
ncbi:MAG: bile acid:sodium symporter family protein [Oleispira sp.]